MGSLQHSRTSRMDLSDVTGPMGGIPEKDLKDGTGSLGQDRTGPWKHLDRTNKWDAKDKILGRNLTGDETSRTDRM